MAWAYVCSLVIMLLQGCMYLPQFRHCMCMAIAKNSTQVPILIMDHILLMTHLYWLVMGFCVLFNLARLHNYDIYHNLAIACGIVCMPITKFYPGALPNSHPILIMGHILQMTHLYRLVMGYYLCAL